MKMYRYLKTGIIIITELKKESNILNTAAKKAALMQQKKFCLM